MRHVLLLLSSLFFAILSFAQAPPPGSFGGFVDGTPVIHDEIPAEVRQSMYQSVRKNIVMLAKKGITLETTLRKEPAATTFGFPLRQAPGFNDPGFYGISNFVDHDATTGAKDFNCGSRTYDAHAGTDFFTVPFWWKKKNENAVEIVAAADGIIVAKAQTRPDTVCAMCPVGAPPECFYWNAVYLRHADGTVSMYGHMKQNSLTTKVVGDAVSKGEFLGIVGSSGNSSGPHMHFEVWQDTFFTKLLDPWGGACNPDGTASMWDAQEPYYNPKIIKVMTGSALPQMNQCYNGAEEKTFAKSDFALGQDVVYVTNFVRDNRVGGPNYRLAVFNPDGTTKYSWTLNVFNGFYPFAWFYYTFQPSEFTIPGKYKFRLIYATDTAIVEFNILNPAPLDLISFNARANRSNVALKWSTQNEKNTSHFEVERSNDASHFQSIGTVSSTGDGTVGTNEYSFEDVNPLPGINYYRLRMVDKDGKFKYSTTEKVNFDGILQVRIFPNPAENFINLQNVSGYKSVTISNMSGRVLLRQPVHANECKIDISILPRGVYVVQLINEQRKLQMKLVKNK